MKRKKEKEDKNTLKDLPSPRIVVDDPPEPRLEDLTREDLLKKEIELRLHIDELEEEIYRLERQILGEIVSDEEEWDENNECVSLSHDDVNEPHKRKLKKSKNDSEEELVDTLRCEEDTSLDIASMMERK
jgi:hypothetical protein